MCQVGYYKINDSTSIKIPETIPIMLEWPDVGSGLIFFSERESWGKYPPNQVHQPIIGHVING